MVTIEYFMRYLMSFLVIAVIINCVWSLIRLRPEKKVYALLQNASNKEEYPITCYETSVGRSKSCDVVFKNTTVSRSHAVIALRSDGFYVFDTDSKMGVYVNGEKIEGKAKLHHGDNIAFGTEIMNFYMGSEADNDISHKHDEPLRMPKLINIADDTEFLIDGDFVTIGREKGSNIELPARYISRKQAEIYKNKNKWYIRDFGSVTNTVLNGDAVEGEREIKDGDVIKFGEFAFLVEM